MLLEFKARNYKTFTDELVFSMIPAPKQKGLDYSILNQKALCSAVLYGPNASGKSNVIGAMDAFKNIVLRGNIRNSNDKDHPNAAAYSLELIPNSLLASPQPVEFSISFVDAEVLVEYSFSMGIGPFLDTEYTRKIVAEQLRVNDKLIFSRKDDLHFDHLQTIAQYLVNEFDRNKDSAISLAQSNLNTEELFLMNGFKTMFSAKIVHVTDYESNDTVHTKQFMTALGRMKEVKTPVSRSTMF